MSLIKLSQLHIDTFAPDHVVCESPNGAIRWIDFFCRCAHLYQTLARTPSSEYLLTSENPVDFLIGFIALLYANKTIIIPANNQAGTLGALKEQYPSQLNIVPLSDNRPTSEMHFPHFDPTTRKIVFFTSGSTGQAKSIEKKLCQIQLELDTLLKLWRPLADGLTIVSTVPHQHLYGFTFRLLLPFVSGCKFDHQICSHPDILSERTHALGKVFLVSSPAHLSRLPDLLHLPQFQSKICQILSAGGALSQHTAHTLADTLNILPLEIYGSTETGAIAFRHPTQSDIWQTLDNISIEEDTDGGLLIKSPYAQHPSATYMRIEDKIKKLSSTEFQWIGRLDRTLKIEEKRVSLPEMEQRLLAHPWVDDAVVVGITRQRQTLGAAVVLSQHGHAETINMHARDKIRVLKNHLAEYYDSVVLPKYWRFIAEMPLNDRGKVALSDVDALFVKH